MMHNCNWTPPDSIRPRGHPRQFLSAAACLYLCRHVLMAACSGTCAIAFHRCTYACTGRLALRFQAALIGAPARAQLLQTQSTFMTPVCQTNRKLAKLRAQRTELYGFELPQGANEQRLA